MSARRTTGLEDRENKDTCASRALLHSPNCSTVMTTTDFVPSVRLHECEFSGFDKDLEISS